MKDTTICSSTNFEIPNVGALFPPEGLQGKSLGIPKLVDKKVETSKKIIGCYVSAGMLN